jgi:hypothetical protein
MKVLRLVVIPKAPDTVMGLFLTLEVEDAAIERS